MRLLGHRGTRIGEASNPGPLFTITSLNVTTLKPNLEYVGNLQGDILALQEVRLTKDGFNYVHKDLETRKWRECWGQAQPIREGTKFSVLDAAQGGVGVLVHENHQVTYTPRTEMGQT